MPRRGRPRLVRSTVADLIDTLTLDVAGEVSAALALALAKQIDRAGREDKAGEVLRLSGELRRVLADLTGKVGGDGGSAGGPDPDRAGAARAGGIDAEFAALVGSGPTVGDAS